MIGRLPATYCAAVLLYVHQMPDWPGPIPPRTEEWDMFKRSLLPWMNAKEARAFNLAILDADTVAGSAFITYLYETWDGSPVPGGMEVVRAMLEALS